MNSEARNIFNTFQALMPTRATKKAFKSAVHHLLKANGKPRPQHCKTTSPSTMSRFHNKTPWDTQVLTRAMQAVVMNIIIKAYKHTRGAGQIIKARLDLTTLEKTGNFPNLPITVFNAVKGLHIIVLYISVGNQSYPFHYAIWKGKGKATLTQLALALLKKLERSLPERFKIRALADTAFGTTEFLETCVTHNIHAVTGMTCDRITEQGFKLTELSRRGAMVFLNKCSVPVWVSWFKLELHGGEFEWRYVVSTKAGDGLTIITWGRARWAIEGFFKVMKSRFGLDQFGQRTLLGTIRFLLLSFLAFILTSISRVDRSVLPDWQALALEVRRSLFAVLEWAVLERESFELEPYLRAAMQDYASGT